MLILAIVAGALLGGAWGDDVFGAAVGALLAWLLVRSVRQAAAIAELKRAIEAGGLPSTSSGRSEYKAQPERESTSAPTAPQPEPDVASAATGLPSTSSGQSEAQPDRESAQPKPVAVPPPAPKPRAPAVDRLAPIKAWLFGGNTIAKLGVAILFVGLAFLAKFASEHVQLPIELRLMAIGAAALGLLAFGWRLRGTRAGYAQVLQGAAVAALYLTLFVAFRTYHVIPGFLAFALMVGVAALAAALAVLQNARSLAVIGAAGGFATPLIVSTGSGNHVALFAYYLALDLGIAAVAWFRHWRVLNLIGFFATFGVATLWGVLQYRPAHYATSQAFLVAFFLLFVAVTLLPARRAARAGASEAAGDDADAATQARARGAAWINGSLLFGLPTVAFALQLGLVRHWPYGSALSALALAAFYVGLAAWLRRHPALTLVHEASLAIAVVFLTLVIPFGLDARSTAGAWALEGAGLVWLGFRQQRRLARAFGYVLLLLAGPTLLWALIQHGPPRVMFNGLLFNGVLAVAGALLAAFFVRRGAAAGGAMPGEAAAEVALVAWATLLALGTAAMQIDEFVRRPYEAAAWLATASGMALLATALAVRWRWPAPAWAAALHVLLLMGVTWGTFVDLRQPLARGGVWAWPLALATHLAVLRWAAPHWPAFLRSATHVLGVLVLAALGALAGRDFTARLGDAASAWAWLGWLVAPALVLMALLRPALMQRWPLAAAPRAHALWAGGVLALGLWAWTLLANLASNGAARPLPHVPLVNPLDIGVGIALAGVWAWLRSAPVREALAGRDMQRWLAPAALGGAGFVWLNAILIRAFHHWDGVPYRPRAWLASLPVHTGLTLLWTATALALMWLAARRAQRAPWIVGAVLLAAVVGKLVWVDLSGSGTVTRIVSFIGVGVLMLVIGYVAPLPAARPARTVTQGGVNDAQA
ncbi:MAG: DUF2339 domain-containing protein [Rubrivivax sp.]|nr:DUF2339 domain-containing protein [Rubrivivax sp.]MCL4695996.1 DUF2339 domain-containing protein [Burkholderiaceae bacterium]